MKEFELCYELDDKSQFSLVPLRFPYTKPVIPWVEIADASQRIVEYHFTGNPPAGLISRFIVKTHHLICRTKIMPKGVFWHNGVFLEQKMEPFRAQALCELDVTARILRFTVRAAFPENFIEKLHGFAQAVFSFYQGFKPERWFGCVADEKPCPGRYRAKTIFAYLKRNGVLICDEDHEIRPDVLLRGLHQFSQDAHLREGLRAEPEKIPEWAARLVLDIENIQSRISRLLTTVNENQGQISSAVAQQSQQAHRELLNLLDQRQYNLIPALVTMTPKNRKFEAIRSKVGLEFNFRFWCEHEDQPHHGTWSGTLSFPSQGWYDVSPYLIPMARLLSLTVAPALAMVPLGLSPEDWAVSKDEVACLEKSIKMMAELGSKDPEFDGEYLQHRHGIAHKFDYRHQQHEDSYRTARIALAAMFEQKFPTEYKAGIWGNLQRYLMRDLRYRWLCQEHRPKQ